MKRTTMVIGCVLCLCLCAVAVTPAMAKNVISPQADKLADHKLDTGMSGKGALKNADEQLINITSAATNAFRMQQFNDSVAWGKGLIAEVNASGYTPQRQKRSLRSLSDRKTASWGHLNPANRGRCLL